MGKRGTWVRKSYEFFCLCYGQLSFLSEKIRTENRSNKMERRNKGNNKTNWGQTVETSLNRK